MPVIETPLSTFPPTSTVDADTHLVVVEDPSGTPIDKLLSTDDLISAYMGGAFITIPVTAVTTVIVSHGQSFTPKRVLLVPGGSALAAILVTRQWWIDIASINSTSFTISFTGAVTGNLEFYFQCFKQ